jgi:hypothetical protein
MELNREIGGDMNDVKKKAHTHSSVENYTKLFQRIAQTLKKK